MQYHYRSYYGAAFVQNDYKVSSRLTLNLGLRWEYVGPALDTHGRDRQRLAGPAAAGGDSAGVRHAGGNTVAANYNAAAGQPLYGTAFGAPPAGVLVRPTNSYYRNGAPLDTFAPRFGFAWQPLGAGGRLAVRGGYGLFYQTAAYSGNAAGTPLFTAPPFAQGFTNADSSNNLSSLQKPFPTTTLGYVLRTPTSQLSDRVAGPEYVVPRLHQWNLSTQFRLLRGLTFDIGYVGSAGQPPAAGARPQSAAAGVRRCSRQLRVRRRGRALHHHEHRAERGAARAHSGGDSDGAGGE